MIRQKDANRPYPWLDPNNKRADANSYFKDISYFVELQGKLHHHIKFHASDIYTLVDSCYYDDSIIYVPILLEI